MTASTDVPRMRTSSSRPPRSSGMTIGAPGAACSRSGRGGSSLALAVTEMQSNGAGSGAPWHP